MDHWAVEQHKIWKGIDPDKPVWHSLNLVSSVWDDANDLCQYLNHNNPEGLYRVNRSKVGVPPEAIDKIPEQFHRAGFHVAKTILEQTEGSWEPNICQSLELVLQVFNQMHVKEQE